MVLPHRVGGTESFGKVGIKLALQVRYFDLFTQMRLFKNTTVVPKILIGVGGRSCSGKGVLCDKIASVNRNILLLKMDVFFKKGTSCQYKGYDCIEHTNCIRFDDLIEAVKALRKGESHVIHSETQGDIEISSEDLKMKDLVIVEGFLLFAERQLVDLFDIRIFIDVSDLNILYRRLLRQSMDGINYIYDVVIPVSKEYEQKQKDNAERIFDGNQSKEKILQDVGRYLSDRLAIKAPHIKIGLPLKRQAWKVYPKDLLSDGEWHPVDYSNLKDWVKARRNELDSGEELRGNTFRYRHNQDSGTYEVRLSSRYNMHHYTPP